MKAVVYRGTNTVQVEDMPTPTVQQPTDAIIKVTSAAICGSDLHMYEGRTPVEEGKILGHEIMGVVHEVGDAITQLKVGDRVVLPFNIACGMCYNCLRGFTNTCLTLNPESPGAAYGFAGMGEYQGGQAEYVHVPYAEFNAIKLPGEAFDEYEDDFLMLADIFPTAYHANKLAKVELGHDVVIYGAGPVGLLSVMSAKMLGASTIFIVDHQPSRLEKAAELGAVPINSDDGDPVEQIQKMKQDNPLVTSKYRIGEEFLSKGVMSGIDAVGYQAHDLSNPENEKHNQVIDQLAQLVLPTGAIGLIGVYLPEDPGEEGDAAEGRYSVPVGLLWNNGVSIGVGQCPVKNYSDYLRDVILGQNIRPGTIVSHHITIDDAPAFYESFDKREPGYIKGVIQFK